MEIHIIYPLILFAIILGGEFIMSQRFYCKCSSCSKQVIVFKKEEANDPLSIYCDKCKKIAIENLLNGTFEKITERKD